ncbi:hypothetical protein [Xenorhabdus littoralis]|uniref:hypothetical protein n=1 Tax=Xenorhabdus littoralis TaxID=2582835 RepID=UPI0029E80C6C|nr:hypothetical protein [Xenorhabdus sp. psl]
MSDDFTERVARPARAVIAGFGWQRVIGFGMRIFFFFLVPLFFGKLTAFEFFNGILSCLLKLLRGEVCIQLIVVNV